MCFSLLEAKFCWDPKSLQLHHCQSELCTQTLCRQASTRPRCWDPAHLLSRLGLEGENDAENNSDTSFTSRNSTSTRCVATTPDFWHSNDIYVKCGVKRAQRSRRNFPQLHLPSNQHLKLCARKHPQRQEECCLGLTPLTPGVKMSPCVWISCPDTERSHQPPPWVFTHRKFKFSSSSTECRLHPRLRTGDDGSPW